MGLRHMVKELYLHIMELNEGKRYSKGQPDLILSWGLKVYGMTHEMNIDRIILVDNG